MWFRALQCVVPYTLNFKIMKNLKKEIIPQEMKRNIDEILEKLKEYNVVNDEIYAETYAKSNPNFSKNKIKQKLMSVGVKSDITENATLEVDDFTSCVKQAEKYMRNKVADKQTTEKLIRRLQGMGYNWDAIKHALNKLKCDTEEE